MIREMILGHEKVDKELDGKFRDLFKVECVSSEAKLETSERVAFDLSRRQKLPQRLQFHSKREIYNIFLVYLLSIYNINFEHKVKQPHEDRFRNAVCLIHMLGMRNTSTMNQRIL
jgi:hypothetical protein